MSTNRAAGVGARWLNFMLGAWLFLSAFLWPHSHASRTNTWTVGALMAVVAVAAMYQPLMRRANTFLAAWLFLTSFWFFHPSTVTIWNNAIVGAIAFVASLVANAAR